MPVRRPHRKSRNGCAECKRRRVKCNEQLPCQNCLKYQSDCVYQSELGPRQQSPASHADRNASTSVVGAMHTLAGTSLCNLARTAEFEARDLELMHHFTTSVAKTLSYRDEIHGAWAIALPKEAYSCDYLMHGLLALSALHLDSSSRGKGHNYADLSTYHVHKSLARFRERLVNISIENCVPLFGNSSLMVIYVCAQAAMEKHSKTARENSQSHIGMLMDIFNMCRGVETVLAPYREEIRQSSLSPLLHEDYCLIPDLSSRRDTDPPEEPRLSYLVNLIRSQNLEPQDQDEYLDALTKLETAFRFMHVAAKPLEPGAAFVWPITLQRGSIRLFTQLSHPHLSLVLIAHYCIILHHLDGYWFLHGWYKALLNEITNTLPPELKRWIRWPRNVCGLVDSGNWNNG